MSRARVAVMRPAVFMGWGGFQRFESRRFSVGQGMGFGAGGVGERAGCCGLKSALRGDRAYISVLWTGMRFCGSVSDE